MTRANDAVSETETTNQPTDRTRLESGTTLADLDIQARNTRAELTRQSILTMTRGVRTLFSALVSRIGRATARRRTMKVLKGLDARTLRDIGIDPSNVAGSMETRFVKGRHPVHSQAALAASMDHLADPLRRWDLSRRAAGELARLPRETLNDLGYGRGDIDSVARTLAQRETANRAANRNDTADRNGGDARKAA